VSEVPRTLTEGGRRGGAGKRIEREEWGNTAKSNFGAGRKEREVVK